MRGHEAAALPLSATDGIPAPNDPLKPIVTGEIFAPGFIHDPIEKPMCLG
jgi:hypothetical protein